MITLITLRLKSDVFMLRINHYLLTLKIKCNLTILVIISWFIFVQDENVITIIFRGLIE